MPDLVNEVTPRLMRVNLFGILSQELRAPRVWAVDIHEDGPTLAPPSSEHARPDELGAWLAAKFATRTARAPLVWLNPVLDDLTIRAGGDVSRPGATTPVSRSRRHGLMVCLNRLVYAQADDDLTVPTPVP